MFSNFDKQRKAQNAHATAPSKMQGKENGFIALGVSVVDQKHEMQSNCPDSFYNFQNIEISKVVTFHWRWVYNDIERDMALYFELIIVHFKRLHYKFCFPHACS